MKRIIKLLKSLLTWWSTTTSDHPTTKENHMEIAVALQIIKLVTTVGVPAAKSIFSTWKDDEPITAEAIRKYQDKFQDPEDYFGNDFDKE